MLNALGDEMASPDSVLAKKQVASLDADRCEGDTCLNGKMEGTPPKKTRTRQRGALQSQNVAQRSTKQGTAQIFMQAKNPENNGFLKKARLECIQHSYQPVVHPPRFNMTARAAEATLGNGCLRDAVKVPEATDRDEWIAVKVFDIFNEAQLVWSLITDQCTCDHMGAGSVIYRNRELPGASAAIHIEHILKHGSIMLHDTDVFPVEPGKPFPPHFIIEVKRFMRRLFRIYAHLYRHHFEYLEENDAVGHINAVFKHYLFFVKEFDLVLDDELKPLKNLIEIFLRSSSLAADEDNMSDDEEELDSTAVKKENVITTDIRGASQPKGMTFSSPIKHTRH